MDAYPFPRTSKSRAPGWEAYTCKFCGEADYAGIDSHPYKDQICADCEIAGVTGVVSKTCEPHGSFKAYTTTRSPDGVGYCSQCEGAEGKASAEIPPPPELVSPLQRSIEEVLEGKVTEETVRVLDEWTRSEPDNPSSWTELSVALTQRAMTRSLRGVDLRPGKLWAIALESTHLPTPKLYDDSKVFWERAVAAADRAVVVNPEDIGALKQRALVALFAQDNKRALQLAKQIVEIQPDHLYAKKILAKVGTAGGCFIATAAFGSDEAPEVAALRRFRDNVLACSVFGRAFVRVYYRLSPPLAAWLRHRPVARARVRALIATLLSLRIHERSKDDGDHTVRG